MASSSSAKATISSKRFATSLAAQAEKRSVYVRVLAAGELGMDAGHDFDERAHAAADVMLPLCGNMTRLMILSNVDLPEPLAPTSPTASPGSTRKLMSFSTQRQGFGGAVAGRRRPTRSARSVVRALPHPIRAEPLPELVDDDRSLRQHRRTRSPSA